MDASDQEEIENVDPDQQLLEDACSYLCSGKEYPAHVTTKNQKRSIRRKAEKLVIKDGEVFYKKQGKDVSSLFITRGICVSGS